MTREVSINSRYGSVTMTLVYTLYCKFTLCLLKFTGNLCTFVRSGVAISFLRYGLVLLLKRERKKKTGRKIISKFSNYNDDCYTLLSRNVYNNTLVFNLVVKTFY